MSTNKRRVETVAYVVRYWIGRWKWLAASLVSAAVGLIGAFSTIPLTINLVFAIGAFFLIFVEAKAQLKRWRSVSFRRRSADSFSDVLGQLEGNKRFRPQVFPHGIFIHDVTLSSKIRSGLVKARVINEQYTTPPEIGDLGLRYLSQALPGARRLHDGDVLGWNTDIGRTSNIDINEIEMQPATFFQKLQTDEFALWDVKSRGTQDAKYGRSLFIDTSHNIRDLGKSWLLNGIGTSTLAFTSDGKLVVIEQSKRNARSRGLYAPSGSGSLEARDFGRLASTTLDHLAANGANRELEEEAGVAESEIVESQFLGFGRWLDKAACPELFTITRLSVSSDELDRRPIPAKEKGFVDDRTTIRLSADEADWLVDTPERMLPDIYRPRASVPLLAALSLLAETSSWGYPEWLPAPTG
ncbi:conserved hypothetical protein [Arthrobacter sp. 9V]|uniref:hypothetical protein n=1 Tax=Arthrobacter sp. 9V TaxID=2653132 RepID=UPI0012F35838|nr:hypothetical protein [Arthrobacter sp. 9V]VXB51826.1 conserved hypothetical protein [Arthrobacter sp. 9V]